MSDQTNVPLEEQAGQPVSEAPQLDQPLTKKEVEELVKDISAKQFQAFQSMQAKMEDRVKKEFERQLKSLSEVGIKLTPEQAAKLQDDTRRSFAESEKEGQHSTANPAPAQDVAKQNTEIHPVVATANEIMRAAGVTIDDNDPEIKLVDNTTKDPLEFLQSVRNAANAKAKRLAESRNKQFDPARTPGVVGAGDHGGNLEAKYREEAKKLQGNVEGLYQLKMKYRGMGLKI